MSDDLDDMMAADSTVRRIAPGDNALRSVAVLAEKTIALEDEISALEELLKRKKEEHRRLTESELPELMAEIGLPSFSTNDGSKIETKVVTRASPPKEKVPAMHKWLRDNNLGDLIKTEVSLSYPAGREDDARWLVEQLSELPSARGVAPEFDTKVHPNTLTAFVKKQLADGKPLPMDLFGVWQGKVAKITRPKA